MEIFIIGAVTDNIILQDKSALNIDIGLTSKPEFDLSLHKYIANIMVNSSLGQNIHEYNNQSFVKLDIKSKVIKNAVVMIQYNIAITNEGDLEGQVNKIVDYLPKDLEFNSELNPNWYLANDGNLYNTELAGKNIGVGETKTVSIVLTKTNVGENTVTYENTAEIAEYYNQEGIKDRDSEAFNKQEDDFSKATLLITIETGRSVIYTTLGLCILVILAVGIYAINRIVLKEE